MRVLFVTLYLTVLLSNPAISTPESEAGSGLDIAVQQKSEELPPEYEKLLQMVREKTLPVQVIDGALNIADNPGVGPKDAKVILAEFGDFQCPYCRRHFQGAAQQIKHQLVSTGGLRYVFLDFPMEAKHPMAAKAAAAARCAEEQGRYWEMRGVLYENQKALHEMFLTAHARSAGMDIPSFETCLESGRYATAIQKDLVVGKRLGVKGTPSFFLGINTGDEIRLVRRIQGAQPYEVFEEQVHRATEIANEQNIDPSRISRSGL